MPSGIFGHIHRLVGRLCNALALWADWFLNLSLFGLDLRHIFQFQTYNLSVAVWGGFLALFGIATDNGVVISTYLNQEFTRKKFSTIEVGKRQTCPTLMTTTTTILVLLPILNSTGRGSAIMVPMAIPSFGGMTLVLVTVFTVPVLYCALEEFRLKRKKAG